MNLHEHPQAELDDVTRALPFAVGPEKSLLSSMMQDPQEYIGLAIEANLTEGHFYLPNHSTLFGFLIDLFEAGHEVELVSLVQRLLDKGLLEKVGGPGYLSEIYTYAPSLGHFRHHLQHVKDKFVLRSLIRNANETVASAYERPDESDQILDEAEKGILAIREGNAEESPVTVKDDIRKIMSDLEAELRGTAKPAGIQTGFEDYDRMTGGLAPGEYHVIAARPSMGKTSFMMNIVENICIDQGIPCLVFSAEMPREPLVKRLVYARAKFDIKQLSRGYKPSKQELQRIQRAMQEIAAAPLIIDDRSGPSISQIRAKARREKRKNNIGLVAIDYLQLCRSMSKQAAGSREREVAEISAGLKGLAKDLGIPVIVLAQINRNAENRTGKSKGKPQMSDLRESGSIEQDADVIGLLYRSKYYAENEEERAALEGKAQLILAKNRNGATGFIPLTFIEELMRFETGPPVAEEDPAPATKNRWQV